MQFDYIDDTHKYLPDILCIIRQGIAQKQKSLKKGNREGLNTQLLVETFNIIGTKNITNKPWIGVQKEHERQKGKGREDIYFHLNDDNYTRVFYMEAKRLPKYKTKNEEEYITGDDSINISSGGIQRYKVSIHGDPNLKYNGMIAYIENKSIEDWILLLNSKLSQIYPEDTPLLSNTYENEYISTHKFENQNLGTFVMHHFWISLL